MARRSSAYLLSGGAFTESSVSVLTVPSSFSDGYLQNSHVPQAEALIKCTHCNLIVNKRYSYLVKEKNALSLTPEVASTDSSIQHLAELTGRFPSTLVGDGSGLNIEG